MNNEPGYAQLVILLGWVVIVAAVLTGLAALLTVNDLAEAFDEDAGFQEYMGALAPAFQMLGVGAIAIAVGFKFRD